MDLIDIDFHILQIITNQADIEDIKQNGGGSVPVGLQQQVDKNTDDISSLKSQADSLTSSLQKLQDDVCWSCLTSEIVFNLVSIIKQMRTELTN